MDKKDFIVTENNNLKLRGFGAKKIASELSSVSQAVNHGITNKLGDLSCCLRLKS